METVAEVTLLRGSDSAVEPEIRSGQRSKTGAQSANSGRAQLLPGHEALARLKLPEAALLLPGDRFILRQFSPVITIGGGVVLDAAPIPKMAGHSDWLQVLAANDAPSIVKARISRRGHQGTSLSRLVAETGWAKGVIETHLAPEVRSGTILRVGNLFIDSRALETSKSEIVASTMDFHQKNPLVGGISKEELRERVNGTPEVFEFAVAALVRNKRLELMGDLARLPGRGVVMKDEEAESKKKIEGAFASAGLKVPALKEVLAGLTLDKGRAQKIVTLLLRDKALIKVSDELVFHRNALEELRRQMAAYKTKSNQIDVAKFKDLTGVTRKYAIPLLEYLDRERVTRRVGDAREIL
jgi:selenocysteine-specific elongation factor